MKPLRTIYLLLLVGSLACNFAMNYKYQTSKQVLKQEQELNRHSGRVLQGVATRLMQTRTELEGALQEAARLNTTIAALEKDNLAFQDQLLVLKAERDQLQLKIAQLTDEKSTLEGELFALQRRFTLVEELKKAFRAAILVKRQTDKAERAQKRLAKIELLKKQDEIALAQGNQGYLVKDGLSTFLAKVRIKVDLEPITEFSYRE